MIVDDDPDVAAESNRLERLRDPSHNTTLTEAEITALVTASGAHVQRQIHSEHPLDFAEWIDLKPTPDD